MCEGVRGVMCEWERCEIRTYVPWGIDTPHPIAAGCISEASR